MASDDSLVRTLLLIVALVVLLPVLVMTLAMPMMGVWGWGHMWNGEMWNGTAGTVVGLVVLLALFGTGYLLFSAVRRPGDDSDPALEELRQAYARGDLSEEEYESRRKRLERDQRER